MEQLAHRCYERDLAQLASGNETRLAVVLLALVACGDNLPPRDDVRSGQRLKLARWQYDDGTRQLETTWYYDAVLRERCTPSAWSDGNRYCAPPTDEAVYVSDSCTRALGRTPTAATPASWFATTFYLQGEPLRSRLFERGEATLAPVTIWQKHANGCIGPMSPGEYFEYFELGREVPDLVRMHRSEPRGDGELTRVDEISDDGLRVPVAYYDRRLGVACTPAERANVESVECVPDDAALVAYFHEVGCLEPELAIMSSIVPATAKQYVERTRCWHYFAVGEEVTAPPLYEALGGSCVPVAPPAGAHFYLTAGPHQTQGLLRVREASTRRLATIDRVRDDLRVPDPLLFDRELATECRREGDARCSPVTDAMIEQFFSDGACATRLDLALVPAGDCDPPVRFARKGDELYPLDQPFTGTIYWLSTGDTCAVYAPPVPFEAWTIGPLLDRATLVPAQLTIDP
ncbi:MAG TPA: hypothetical protein VIV11_35160 [Kofleriaceae bacterium]